MGLRFIPPGKKSLKKPTTVAPVTPEVIESVIEAAEAVVAEVGPLIEVVSPAHQEETVATVVEADQSEAPTRQEVVEQKVVETSSATNIKRKK